MSSLSRRGLFGVLFASPLAAMETHVFHGRTTSLVGAYPNSDAVERDAVTYDGGVLHIPARDLSVAFSRTECPHGKYPSELLRWDIEGGTGQDANILYRHVREGIYQIADHTVVGMGLGPDGDGSFVEMKLARVSDVPTWLLKHCPMDLEPF